MVAGQWLQSNAALVLPIDQAWPRRLSWTEAGWKITPEGGFNVFLLMHERAARKGNSPYWMSVREAEKIGGVLKSGAVGVTVAQWRWTAKTPGFNGDITPKMAGSVQEAPEAIEDLTLDQKAVAMRPVVLFNVEDWVFPEGVKLPANPLYRLPTPQEAREAAENILATEAGCEIRHGGTSAFYNPATNEIVLPPRESFKGDREYFWAAFEQLGHAIAGRHQMDLWEAQNGLDFSKNMDIKRLYTKMVAAMMAYESGIDVL